MEIIKARRYSSFNTFMREQRKVDTPVGDLARDMSYDKNFPKVRTKSQLLRYLNDLNACSGALRAAGDAWSEFEKAKQ